MFANRAEGICLALPAALFVLLVFAAPVVALLSEGFSLEAYRAFFAEPLNVTVFVRTLRLGLEVTAAAAVLGYAAAYAIVALPANSRGKMIGLVLLPMMVSNPKLLKQSATLALRKYQLLLPLTRLTRLKLSPIASAKS